MDAITLLKADHRKVEALFKDVEALGDSAHSARAKLFAQIDVELTAHAKAEEEIFYPALKAKTKRNDDASDEVLEAYEEHANVKSMLAKLESTDPKDETYNAKLQVLTQEWRVLGRSVPGGRSWSSTHASVSRSSSSSCSGV